MKGDRQLIWEWACDRASVTVALTADVFGITVGSAKDHLASLVDKDCMTRKVVNKKCRAGTCFSHYEYCAVKDCPPPGTGNYKHKKTARPKFNPLAWRKRGHEKRNVACLPLVRP